MKISRKVEYASRVLAQLARCHGSAQMPHTEELARAEDVPANYLVQILNELRSAGLILSRRGKQGGYMLARAPEEISIADIFQAIDGELLESSSQVGGESGPGVTRVLERISSEFQSSASALTIKDVLEADSAAMYFI